MTTPRSDHDIALPHAALLAYFCHCTSPSKQLNSESSPPPYHKQTLYSAHPLANTQAKHNDEESSLGFWGEQELGQKDTPTAAHTDLVKRKNHGLYAVCSFWFVISICILGAFGAVLTLDLVFRQLGMSIGIATYIVHGNVGLGAADYKMHFCLATPNRQAPGPQIWRYVEGNGIADCTTEALTLLASSTEVWKLRPDDDVVFDEFEPLKSGYEVRDDALSVADKIRLVLGDDLAEERGTRL